MAAINGITITIDPVSKRINVTAPYHADWTIAAKAIGGRWDALTRSWFFLKANETDVRALCSRIYGTDNGVPALNRAQLEERLNRYLILVCEIQEQLEALDKAEGKA